MSLSANEQREVLAAARRAPALDAIGMKVIQGLLWAAENEPVRTKELTASAQHQLALILHATLRETIAAGGHSRAELEALIETVVRRVLDEQGGR